MRGDSERLRLSQLIEEAKASATYPGIDWDNFRWSLTVFCTDRAHDKRELNLYFTRRRQDRSAPYVPFEQPFADFAKALVRSQASERDAGFKDLKHLITALRFLYEALSGWSTTDPTHLTRGHFQSAVLAAHDCYAHGTSYNLGHRLEQISKIVDDRRITRMRTGFVNPISHPAYADGLDEESQARGMLKMPTRYALENLALASNKPFDDNERILLRVVDLLVTGGFRIGEALTIPVNCWIEEAAFDRQGRPKLDPRTSMPIKRYGLRYWPEKGASR
jgi:hypothetical protein